MNESTFDSLKVPAFSLWLALVAIWPTSIASAEVQQLHGHVPAAIAGLQSVGQVPETNQLHLAIGLPLRNSDSLNNLLQRIYDPASPDYHHYLSPEQFAEKFGPTTNDYETLIHFIKSNGITVTYCHSNRTLLDVSGSVANIEKLLHVTLRLYPHPREARTFYAPDSEPSIDVSVPILHISGLDNLVVPRPMNLKADPNAPKPQAAALGSGPGGTYLGNDFRAAYVPGSLLTGSGQIVGLLEFDNYFSNDVVSYRNLAGLPAVPLKTVLLDGFNGLPGNNNTEVSLDIDMATSLAPGLSGIIVYEGETTDDILNRMATDNLAKQLSASWLYPIDTNTEQIFQQFGAQGQSFFNAAGDSDAYAGGVATPADDPNITVVGGTTLTTAEQGGPWSGEVVWNWGGGTGTGGGISTTYPIPIWQQGVSMASNSGSTNMRNLPDVAMVADNVWLVYNNGSSGSFGGTSCATPLWAAFTALVNQQAVANGKPTQGFINPAVYAIGLGSNYASVFHDITFGNNFDGISQTNFTAVPGYDLCTGWGTPNGTNLINLLAPFDVLRVAPGAGLTLNAGSGGPFAISSVTYLLTNTGPAPLKWAASTNVAWLAVSPSGGTLLPAGPSTSVTVSLNSAASNLVAGSYSGSVQFTNVSDGFAQSRPFVLNIITPPEITRSPTNQSVLGGATALFAAQAIGGLPLSCQWQRNGTNMVDGGNISGSSTPALTVATVAEADIGLYDVVVGNAAGAVTSAPPALLSILPSGPVITLQPASQYALAGATVTFPVAVLGDAPLFYQWQRNNVNLTDGGSVSGSATSTLTIGPALANNSGTYAVIVQNALNTVTSSNAVFAVYALEDSELLQNGGFESGNFSFWNQSGNSSFDSVSTDPLFAESGLYGAELGASGSLGYISQTVPTTPGGVYQLSFWLDSPDGATPNEFVVLWNGYVVNDQSNLTAFGWSNFQYAVTATATSTAVQFGFRNDSSFFGLDNIILKPLLPAGGAPVITMQPASQVYAAVGLTATISASVAGGQPLGYQWESNSARIPNATNATLVLSNIAPNQAGTYSLIISNAAGQTISSNSILAVLGGNLELITFDDLGANNVAIPDGYDGLSWSNFFHMDTAISAPNPSGYIAGTISQPNAAYNNLGGPAYISSLTPFDFLSAWVTAAWDNNLRLEVRGYAGNALVYDAAYELSSTAPALINFNCIGVTNIEFITSGGTPNSSYGGSGEEFVMDNASVIANTGAIPSNISCADAIVITNDPYTNIESTLGAGAAGDPVPTCISGFTNGVWYRYTPPASGLLEVDTTGSDFASGFAVYTGTCGSLTQFACNQNLLAVNGGVTYYFLAGATENLSGNMVFHLSFSSATTGPPLIVSPPTNVSVQAGSPASFSVAAEGQQPLSYFWSRNGTLIAGATASTYTTNNVQLTDSGAQFSCLVSNALGATNSPAAQLMVTIPGQLVQNGGFETGDFSYWTESGNFEDCYVNSTYVHSGQYGASLGPVGSLGYLSQALTTAPGQLYLLSLWLYSTPGETPNEFSVAWNGTMLFDQTNIGGIAWSNLLFYVSAPSTNTLLKIGFRNDPSFLGLDDITALPLKPVLQSVTHNNSSLTFGWSAMPGSVYQIQFATNLTQTNWSALGTNITAGGYSMSTTESISNNPAAYYRVVLLP